MAKYTEQHALKAKQDVKRASEELAKIDADKNKASEELVRINEVLDSERKKIATIWQDVGRNLQLAQAAEASILKDVTDLRLEKQELNASIKTLSNLLRDTADKIRSLRIPKENFLSDLLNKITVEMSKVLNRKNQEAEIVDHLSKEHERLETNIEGLHAVEMAHQEEVKRLTEDKEEVEKRLASHQETIKEIELRDNESRVMAARLTKEYQDVYFAQNKK